MLVDHFTLTDEIIRVCSIDDAEGHSVALDFTVTTCEGDPCETEPFDPFARILLLPDGNPEAALDFTVEAAKELRDKLNLAITLASASLALYNES